MWNYSCFINLQHLLSTWVSSMQRGFREIVPWPPNNRLSLQWALIRLRTTKCFVILGHLCPMSHPIPCANGVSCTSKVLPSDPSYCNPDNVNNGLCCPDDNVPCKYNKPDYRCQAHPKYGMMWICEFWTIQILIANFHMCQKEQPAQSPILFHAWEGLSAQRGNFPTMKTIATRVP